jgi:hypothetical protein
MVCRWFYGLLFRLFLTDCSHRDLLRDSIILTMDAHPPSMICLSLLRTSVPCETPLDGRRTTCRRKHCIAFRNSKPSYQAHHEVYKELIAGKLFDDAIAHRVRCLQIYVSDAHIAVLKRRVANQASIYKEQLLQQISERQVQEELNQAEGLVSNLQGMSLVELEATQFTLEYGAGADVGEDLADAYPDEDEL